MKKYSDSTPPLLAHREVTRREVLKWCAALGGASLLPMGSGLPVGLARAATQPPYGAGEQCFYSGCVVNLRFAVYVARLCQRWPRYAR